MATGSSLGLTTLESPLDKNPISSNEIYFIIPEVLLQNELSLGRCFRILSCAVETTYSGRSDNSLKNVPQTRLVQSNGADYSPLWGIDHIRSKTRFQLASGYPQGSL